MKKLIRHGLVAGLVALSTTGVALADGEGEPCSLKTLQGRYVFTARGFNIAAGVAQPKAILEIVDFNGDRTLAVPAATVAINGAIVRALPSVGTYTVDEGCTGTISLVARPTTSSSSGRARSSADPDEPEHRVPGERNPTARGGSRN